MQQLYPGREALSLFRYAGSKILFSFLLLASSSSFSQVTTSAGQTNTNTAGNIKTTGPNLPNLVSFAAQLTDQKVTFNWTTSYEENLSHFTVQRSLDGKSFEDRAVIFSDGNTASARQYVFSDNISDLDNGQNSGQIYYRLKLVNLDGQPGYSQTLIVLFSDGASRPALVAYPNPAVSELRVVLPVGWQNKPVSYNVYNSSGRLVLRKFDNPSGESETVNVAPLHIGMYLLRVTAGNQAMVQSFVKAN